MFERDVVFDNQYFSLVFRNRLSGKLCMKFQYLTMSLFGCRFIIFVLDDYFDFFDLIGEDYELTLLNPIFII